MGVKLTLVGPPPLRPTYKSLYATVYRPGSVRIVLSDVLG